MSHKPEYFSLTEVKQEPKAVSKASAGTEPSVVAFSFFPTAKPAKEAISIVTNDRAKHMRVGVEWASGGMCFESPAFRVHVNLRSREPANFGIR